jgi:hypothetical protein
MRRLAGLLMIALALLVTACGPVSKEDLVAKAREVKTRAELERALGKPDDVSKRGLSRNGPTRPGPVRWSSCSSVTS